jgi:DNA primase
MSDAVQQIKDKLSIFDVVSPYVELHRAGKNFKGKSPFTAEKTPSFYVSPDRGMYYCFSTSQGGDMFTFIQAMEGVDFKESLKMLAQKAGVELVAEDPKKKTERENWYASLVEATKFYCDQLAIEKSAQAYLVDRGVKPETIQNWQIGFAPGPPKSGWREVKDHLEAKGYKRELLERVGLIKSTDGGKEPYDVFRDRIMFSLRDSGGKVVGFSGRILSKDTQAPKYVNSPETELYKKSELLYGYDKAKHGIRTFNFSLIVEGQFDVVMSHQAGYTNTVAVSGTALTVHHVQLLERLSDRVVLALDADRAGIAAMKRSADLMLRRGIDVKVAELPVGSDPADIIRVDVAQFKQIVGKSVHVIEFLLHVLKQQHTEERTLKLKTREEILPFLLLLPNRIDQEHFVGIVANAIGSTTDAIRFELDRLREQPATNSLAGEFSLTDKVAGEAIVNEAVKNHQLFLEAAANVVASALQKIITDELSTLFGTVERESLEESELARATFSLEQQFADMTELMLYEEVAARLNQLRTSLTRRTIAIQKQLLVEAELSQNDELFTTALQAIGECEKVLKQEAYQAEALLGKK